MCKLCTHFIWWVVLTVLLQSKPQGSFYFLGKAVGDKTQRKILILISVSINIQQNTKYKARKLFYNCKIYRLSGSILHVNICLLTLNRLRLIAWLHRRLNNAEAYSTLSSSTDRPLLCPWSRSLTVQIQTLRLIYILRTESFRMSFISCSKMGCLSSGQKAKSFLEITWSRMSQFLCYLFRLSVSKFPSS